MELVEIQKQDYVKKNNLIYYMNKYKINKYKTNKYKINKYKTNKYKTNKYKKYINCCRSTKKHKKCKRKDNKIFSLPRKFSKKKCKKIKGFTMKSSCAPYKFC